MSAKKKNNNRTKFYTTWQNTQSFCNYSFTTLNTLKNLLHFENFSLLSIKHLE